MYIPRMQPRSSGIRTIRIPSISLDRTLLVLVLLLLVANSIDHGSEYISSRGATETKPEVASMEPLFVLAKGTPTGQFGESDTILRVDRLDFARQIAISIIVNEDHEITDHRVTFKRDPDKQGTAIQQFAEVFGRVIEQGIEPNRDRP